MPLNCCVTNSPPFSGLLLDYSYWSPEPPYKNFYYSVSTMLWEGQASHRGCLVSPKDTTWRKTQAPDGCSQVTHPQQLFEPPLVPLWSRNEALPAVPCLLSIPQNNEMSLIKCCSSWYTSVERFFCIWIIPACFYTPPPPQRGLKKIFLVIKRICCRLMSSQHGL